MIWKTAKIGSLVLVVGLLSGALVFGRDLYSYVHSSAHAVQTAVKDSVPIEFELRRARDLLDQIIPEMHANIRLIAQEEVEVAALEQDIAASESRLVDERTRVARLRDALDTEQVSFVFAGQRYDRTEVRQDLARRLDRVKESTVMLASKQRLLETRRQSLVAARDMLERTRHQKVMLEDRIGALEGQYRLVQAASIGSKFQVDNSKLAQTEKLIDQIKKRLDVAERVLAHESQFVQPIPVETVSEEELLSEVDEFLAGGTTESSESVSDKSVHAESRAEPVLSQRSVID